MLISGLSDMASDCHILLSGTNQTLLLQPAERRHPAFICLRSDQYLSRLPPATQATRAPFHRSTRSALDGLPRAASQGAPAPGQPHEPSHPRHCNGRGSQERRRRGVRLRACAAILGIRSCASVTACKRPLTLTCQQARLGAAQTRQGAELFGNPELNERIPKARLWRSLRQASTLPDPSCSELSGTRRHTTRPPQVQPLFTGREHDGVDQTRPRFITSESP